MELAIPETHMMKLVNAHATHHYIKTNFHDSIILGLYYTHFELGVSRSDLSSLWYVQSLLVAKLSSNDPVVIQVHKIIFDTFSFWKLFYSDLLSHIFPYGVLHTRNGQKQHPSVRILLAILTVVELMVHVIHFTWLAQ